MSFCDLLQKGKFMVTAELSPPKGIDITSLLEEADLIKNVVDAINVTDNQRAVMRMDPVAACAILKDRGHETIMHLTCRDRNRLALQSELLGAGALGINNVLAMSGDHPLKGDHKSAKPVFDLDSVQLLELINELNNGLDLSGNVLNRKTNFCTGAVSNTVLNEVALLKLEKKIKAGASFIQTQAVFDVDIFSGFMEKIDQIRSKEGSGVRVIAGIIPLRSVENAVFLNSNIPGINVPDYMIRSIWNSRDPERAGIEMAAQLIEKLRSICDGVHIMPIGTHRNTREMLEMAGIK